MAEIIQFPNRRGDIDTSTAELHQRQIEIAAMAIVDCGHNHPITKDALKQLSEDQVIEAIKLSEQLITPPEAS